MPRLVQAVKEQGCQVHSHWVLAYYLLSEQLWSQAERQHLFYFLGSLSLCLNSHAYSLGTARSDGKVGRILSSSPGGCYKNLKKTKTKKPYITP
jgi:hypothetical protein